MKFLFTISITAALFCTACAIGSILTLLVQVIFRRRRQHFLFSLACIMLSLAIIVAAVALIFIPQIEQYFVFSDSLLTFLMLVAVVGFITGIVPKVLLPVFIVLYAGAAIASGFLFRDIYGSQKKSVEVALNRNSISINGIQYEIPEDSQNITVKYKIGYLDERVVLPVKRVWCYPDEILYTVQESTAGAAQTSETASASDNSEQTASQIQHSITVKHEPPRRPDASPVYKCIEKNEWQTVEVPVVSFYPAFFQINAKASLTGIEFSVTKDF